MATGLNIYERTQHFIGVSVSKPAAGADVLKALTLIYQLYEEHHGKPVSDDSITVTVDEENIYFEFFGSGTEKEA